jgi:hypothetical protein
MHAQTAHLDRRLLVQKVIMDPVMQITVHPSPQRHATHPFKAYPYQGPRSSCQASKGASPRPSS